jgi:hypothetical protein
MVVYLQHSCSGAGKWCVGVAIYLSCAEQGKGVQFGAIIKENHLFDGIVAIGWL